jgi:hypothetical protein
LLDSVNTEGYSEMVRNAKRSGRIPTDMLPGYRPVEIKFRKIPSLPDLDLRTSEYVYFVESDTPAKLIKIGRSESLKKRLMGLQMVSPVQLRLIAAVRAPSGTEFLLHNVFASARAHGEWFIPTTQLIELAKQLPKMGTLTHEDVRQICAARGCDELLISKAFMRSDRYKKRRLTLRYGRLAYR